MAINRFEQVYRKILLECGDTDAGSVTGETAGEGPDKEAAKRIMQATGATEDEAYKVINALREGEGKKADELTDEELAAALKKVKEGK